MWQLYKNKVNQLQVQARDWTRIRSPHCIIRDLISIHGASDPMIMCRVTIKTNSNQKIVRAHQKEASEPKN